MAGNPFDQFDGPSSLGGLGGLRIGTPDPRKQQRDDLAIQEARLRVAKMTNDANKPDPNAPMPVDPRLDGLTGKDYLSAIPKTRAIMVRALAEGRQAFPAGKAATSPYWQTLLNDVAHYDPTFDAVNFNARSNTRKDFTSGKSSNNIKALNTAIGHVGQLSDQISGTAAHGGFPFATTVNAIQNSFNRGSGSSGPTLYDQTTGAVASELTQVFRGSGGAEADVKRYLSELSTDASAEQKHAAIKNIAGLLQSRLDAIGDQYTKGMGTTAQPLQLLDEHAKKVIGAILPSSTYGTGGGAAPQGGGSGPTAPGGMPTLSPTDQAEITRLAPYMSADGMQKWFADKNQPISADNAKAVHDYYAKGGTQAPGIAYDSKAYDAKLDAINKPKNDLTGPMSKGTLAANGLIGGSSPVFAGGIGGIASAIRGEGFMPGYRLYRDAETRRFAQGREANGIGGMIAEGGGMALGTMLTGGALGATSKAGMLASDMAFGGATGGFNAASGDTLAGTALGTVAAGGGNLLSRAAAVPMSALARTRLATNAVDRLGALIGRTPSATPQALNPAEGIVAREAGRDPSIIPYLQQAQDLNVPASLADANPSMRSLAGAAVRRSPTAALVAENALQPRALGQIDRLGAAVNRDFGPTANIPQASDDLIARARAAAAPLYEQAYASPPIGSPRLDQLLATPAAGQATARAHTIAGNEMRNPSAMGFRLNADGTVALSPTSQLGENAVGDLTSTLSPQRQSGYTPQTLDYVKRGLDDVIESQRDKVTGRLNLDEAGHAINGVRAQLLQEVDRLNPAYGQARAAYAGPASQRAALTQGQNAQNVHPDVVTQALARLSPSELPQYQLGFRSGMMDKANNAQLSANPFDRVYGTPQQQQRIATVFPEQGAIARFAQQAQMERNLARTNTEVMGGSQTAGRQVADQQFEGGLGPAMAADAVGALTMGMPPVGTARHVARNLTGDILRLGVGQRAIAKADGLAPMLLDTSPQNTIQMLQNLAARQAAFDDYVTGQRAQFARPLGLGLSSAGVLAGSPTP